VGAKATPVRPDAQRFPADSRAFLNRAMTRAIAVGDQAVLREPSLRNPPITSASRTAATMAAAASAATRTRSSSSRTNALGKPY